jgi:hypothetical protein
LVRGRTSCAGKEKVLVNAKSAPYVKHIASRTS